MKIHNILIYDSNEEKGVDIDIVESKRKIKVFVDRLDGDDFGSV